MRLLASFALLLLAACGSGATPAATAANKGRLYFEDDGAGKTRLMCLFNTGAAQQVAIEP